MISIEDRLSGDARITRDDNSSADWANVVGRTDRRVRRQQTAMRTAVFAFLALIGLAVVFGQGDESIVAEGPFDLAPPASEGAQADQPSIFLTYLALALTWGVSILIGSSCFFASPRAFRAPYRTQRIGRLVAALSWVSFWNLLTAGVTGLALLATDSTFVTATHSSAGVIIGIAVAILVLALVIGSVTGRRGIGVIFIPACVSAIWSALAASSEGDALLLTVHVLGGMAFGGAALYPYLKLGYHVDRTRFARERFATVNGRKKLGGLMVLVGVVGAALWSAPSVAITTQLEQRAPEISGWELEVFDSGLDSHTQTVPNINILYRRTDQPDGSFRDRAENAWVAVLNEFVPDADPTFAGQFAGQFADLSESMLLTELSSEVTGLTLEVQGRGAPHLTVAPTDSEPFEQYRRWRNLSAAIALLGAMWLWSETAISRFTGGPNPLQRHSRQRESTGWVLFCGGAAITAISGLVPLFIPSVSSGGGIWGGLLTAAIGGTMVTPPFPPK